MFRFKNQEDDSVVMGSGYLWSGCKLPDNFKRMAYGGL